MGTSEDAPRSPPGNPPGLPVYTPITPWATRKIGMDFQAFDAAYIDNVRAGDPEAERHFVAYFSELILLKLRSRLRSEQAIEDVRQETFGRTLALLRSDHGIRNPERLGAIVNSICNHVLFEHYRASGRAQPLDEFEAEQFVEPGPDPLNQTIREENRRIVREVLEKLAERDRRVLQSVFLEERDKDDVCREMGVTREYIRVLLHRAKQAFREAHKRRVGSSWRFIFLFAC